MMIVDFLNAMAVASNKINELSLRYPNICDHDYCNVISALNMHLSSSFSSSYEYDFKYVPSWHIWFQISNNYYGYFRTQ